MANYVKATNFTAKDSLPTGNSGKIVKGAELDTEYTAIASAISSKSDINSPTFTGTPAAPTVSNIATNTTQIATTAFVQAVVTGLALGNMSTQSKSAVDITGGTITGITDLAIADGGTGASTAANARTNLGLGSIATQNSNAVTITGGSVTGITDIAVADGGTGASTASDARTNLGLGSIATQNANSVSISGGSITGITDLAVADGGTGSSSLSANAVLLGNGTSALQTVAPSTSGNVLTSNGSTWTSAAPTVVKGLGLGGEVYNNVTSSRALNNTYTNNRSYPIMVIASNGVNNGPTGIQIVINGTTISNQTYDANGTYGRGTVTFIVPPSATYAVTGSASVQYWYELY